MDWHDHITLDPEIVSGKPLVKGTRLSVEFVVDLLAKGWTVQDIAENYPGLGRQEILACLEYASETLRAQRVYPLAV
ncbi:DUF433 domain-containing protein [Desulfolutivibrio sulfoxidireducens]|uniref:DUF433 domain-containing protein n=1 Tax=Desulfolutivibrio sulfoxidireducens TaxID=2773299 RepID=UPI00159D4157|nr:DUF433 domain-containing protein [Desulfolutivibrio sulfoxidireducens]QLA16680.1 DUF433 domain-containing protein [Desulfolutivibrio sulfoxidireducens]QLA19443.1 DUF433 domain-containing protein [Desulfolutivibrio sulfoxidireducens]